MTTFAVNIDPYIMNFAEKIKADFEAITGLTLLYGSRDGINWAISHNALPAGFFTLIRSSNVNADGLSIKESAEVAVSVIRLSPAEEPGYKTEETIEECRQQVFAYLTALKSSGLMNLRSVTRASRIFDEFDDIICGFGVNIIVEEIDGTRCMPWSGPTLNITENGDYETLRYGQVHVDVQGGSPAVVEPLSVVPDYDPHTFNPPAGVDGFAPVEVAACPVPDVRPLSVTPSRNAQTFAPSGFDGYAPVEVEGYTPVLQEKTATPATTAQVVTADGGYDGLSSVEVAAVDASIDANIQAGNIKQGVTILGVAGTMEPMPPTPQGAIFTLLRPDGTTQVLHTDDQTATLTSANSFLASCASVRFESEYVTTLGQGAFYTRNLCREIIMHGCSSITGGQNFRSAQIEHIELGTLTYIQQSPIWSGTGDNIRYFGVMQGSDVDMPLRYWTAANVIAEGQYGIDELNYNIKTYIADKVADRTGDSARTITFGASLYNVLTPATIAAFTAKNWSVASA